MSKTIGIVGSRRRDSYEDFQQVWEEFSGWYEEGDSICSGLCPKGADRFAVIIANRLDLLPSYRLWFPPDWKKYGKRVGFVRNTDIAKHSDILIACVASDRTGGTEDTIKKWKGFHGTPEHLRILLPVKKEKLGLLSDLLEWDD